MIKKYCVECAEIKNKCSCLKDHEKSTLELCKQILAVIRIYFKDTVDTIYTTTTQTGNTNTPYHFLSFISQSFLKGISVRHEICTSFRMSTIAKTNWPMPTNKFCLIMYLDDKDRIKEYKFWQVIP